MACGDAAQRPEASGGDGNLTQQLRSHKGWVFKVTLSSHVVLEIHGQFVVLGSPLTLESVDE